MIQEALTSRKDLSCCSVIHSCQQKYDDRILFDAHMALLYRVEQRLKIREVEACNSSCLHEGSLI